MFAVYEVLLYLVFIVLLPFFLVTGLVRGKYLTNFSERMGFYRSKAAAHDLWLHAVSVGEVLASQPVMKLILGARPDLRLVVTTTTITGQAQARRLYPNATVAYFPFDFTVSVNRFLDHHRPRAFATMETEIWPNVTRIARKRGLRMILANGRISDRSFPRYRAMRFALRTILGRYDRILAREMADRERFIAIGAPAANVEMTGNVKFDYDPDATPLDIAPVLEPLIAGRKTIIFGSTMEGEDEMLLPEIEQLVREHSVFVIIAPRKAERFDAVAALLSRTSLPFVRRRDLRPGATGSVMLLDTFGELARMYRYATAAFVGGSLIPYGGHNPIEPAAAGVPVTFGPSMTNFREIAAVFLTAKAAEEVASAADVRRFMERMLDDELTQRAVGERARQTVAQNRGASRRTADRILELLA